MNMKSIALAAALAGSMAAIAPSAQAGPDDYIGEIFMTAANFCPRGTARADGQLLAISGNEALFSLLGTTYGGDGRSTFALPDLRGRVAVHPGTGPGLSTRQLGERGGTEAQVLSPAQLPTHTHTLNSSESNPDSGNPSGRTFGTLPAGEIYAAESSAGTATMSKSTIGLAGNSQPVRTIDPFLSVNFCVVMQGIFPARN